MSDLEMLEAVVKPLLGKTIVILELSEDILKFTFEDGTQLELWDNKGECCERRYMRTDDNLADYVGGHLLGIELRYAPDHEDESGDVHESQFLAVKTTKGQCVMSNHNVHNGYYDGFSITAKAS